MRQVGSIEPQYFDVFLEVAFRDADKRCRWHDMTIDRGQSKGSITTTFGFKGEDEVIF